MSRKTAFSVGDGLLCVALSMRLNRTRQAVRNTAARVQKRLPKANRYPFALIATSKDPHQQYRIIMKELFDEPTQGTRLP